MKIGVYSPISKIVAVLGLFLYIEESRAQEKQVIHQDQQWLEYTARLKVSEKYAIIGDLGCRWLDNYTKGTFYYVRGGAEYNVNKNIALHAGFIYLGYFFDNEKLSQVEYRPYQEMSILNYAGKISIFQRLRVEERFFEPVSASHATPFNHFNWRFRYMLLVDIPLFRFSKEHPDYRMSLALGDEIMMNAGKSIIHNQFSQNRLLISPTFHMGADLEVALIWSNQYSSTFTPNRFIQAQVFWLQFRQRFDLTKSAKKRGIPAE